MRPHKKALAAISAQNSVTVRKKARIERRAPEMQPAITRLVHACGMAEMIADRLAWSPDPVGSAKAALQAGARNALCMGAAA